ncbi:hypothetical protein TWF730_001452 [Orbilia blumenaviensis]|uniref:Uncharacterized protein n=1 Tax=Orbilia blumenaviensis TaxID=1796055 RepID=A0AAV9ULB6_9PEZI
MKGMNKLKQPPATSVGEMTPKISKAAKGKSRASHVKSSQPDGHVLKTPALEKRQKPTVEFQLLAPKPSTIVFPSLSSKPERGSKPTDVELECQNGLPGGSSSDAKCSGSADNDSGVYGSNKLEKWADPIVHRHTAKQVGVNGQKTEMQTCGALYEKERRYRQPFQNGMDPIVDANTIEYVDKDGHRSKSVPCGAQHAKDERFPTILMLENESATAPHLSPSSRERYGCRCLYPRSDRRTDEEEAELLHRWATEPVLSSVRSLRSTEPYGNRKKRKRANTAGTIGNQDDANALRSTFYEPEELYHLLDRMHLNGNRVNAKGYTMDQVIGYDSEDEGELYNQLDRVHLNGGGGNSRPYGDEEDDDDEESEEPESEEEEGEEEDSEGYSDGDYDIERREWVVWTTAAVVVVLISILVAVWGFGWYPFMALGDKNLSNSPHKYTPQLPSRAGVVPAYIFGSPVRMAGEVFTALGLGYVTKKTAANKTFWQKFKSGAWKGPAPGTGMLGKGR